MPTDSKTTPPPPAPAPDRAQALYVAEALEDRPLPEATRRLGIADLVAFLRGDGMASQAAVNRALLRQPGLREDFRLLRDAMARVPMPGQAAASDNTLDRRRFPGGTTTLFTNEGDRFVYLAIQFDAPEMAGATLALSLETTDGAQLLLALPETDDAGATMAILDPARPEDEALIADLRAPGTQGAFLARDRRGAT